MKNGHTSTLVSTLVLTLTLALTLLFSLLPGTAANAAEEQNAELFLSDLTPVSTAPVGKVDPNTGAPVAGYTADSVINRFNGSGNTLVLNGRTYEKGIGLVPYGDDTSGQAGYINAEAVFDISGYSGTYDVFLATVGRRDWPEDPGPYVYSMVCRIYVDNVLAAESPSLNFGEVYEAKVSIKGAKELKLVTTCGTDTYHYDCSVWGNARLAADKSFAPSSIEFTSFPAKSIYAAGEALNMSGGSITVKYSDGSTAQLPMLDTMVTGYDPQTTGKQQLAISYLGHQEEWTVTVADLVYLSDIAPKSLNILENEVDTFGIDTTSKGSPIIINEIDYKKGFGVHPFEDASAEIEYDISAYSGEYNIFYAVAGKDKTAGEPGSFVKVYVYVDGVQAAESDYLTYGDEFVIAVDISGGSTLLIEVSPTEDGYHWDSTCFGDAMLLKAAIEKKELELPEKLEYEKGKLLNLTGGAIVYYYDNGIVSRVPLTDEMVRGFDKDTAGTQTLTVEYGGETFSFEVTVKELEPDPTAQPTAEPKKTADPSEAGNTNAPDDKNGGKNSWIAPVVIAAAAVCVIIIAVTVILKKSRKQGK